ncbi:hypothetical protein IFM89_007990 [Coptis chinensis]|uniref:J domain-containing protein n=1 Tax=Coptis chinensis TaxID=261450 RepID=A0A835ILZ6_9MAGN|nr:hypothetical protein IFM89_007990 [Coptis chinensis]
MASLLTGRNKLLTSIISNRLFSSNNLAGKNAYDVLGISQTSSFSEIKASFRQLAKQTHPDLSASSSHPNTSQRFVQILAAYEILSDTERRAHYDNYLFSQRKFVQKHSRYRSVMYTTRYESCEQMEVVEWLRWYRYAINDIVSHKHIVSGTGYFDVLQKDFYSAINAAYHGPAVESLEFLPDCFEAEERSGDGIPEVLHLVSGRELFGIVSFVDKHLELTNTCFDKLTCFTSVDSGLRQSINTSNDMKSASSEIPEVQTRLYGETDVYKDLELHISGTVVAKATRVPPKTCWNGIQNEDSEDHIHVFFTSDECEVHVCKERFGNSFSSSSFGSRILLGTITGLGTSQEEGSCFVYNNTGARTHALMKHRTLLVKHMHWYRFGDEVSVCECRCTRARLPPSKFWLFEPRCTTHDIGGWYVETYGRDKRGRTIPSQRHWDGFDMDEQHEKRLHPAMYLFALAYRTLDLEEERKRKWRVRDILEPRIVNFIHWWKRVL